MSSACRKTPGLIRGRSPLWLYSDLATQGELPRRGKRRPPGGCASNPQKALAQQGFPCIRCWPRHRRKHRMKKLEKVAFSHFFDSLASASSPEAEVPILYCSPDAFSPSRGRSLRIPPALHHNNKRPPQGRSFVIGGAGEIRPAALGQCRRQLGELKSHPPDAFSPSRGRSLRIPPALHHNNKRPPQGRSFVIGGAGEIRTHGRLSTVTRFPVVPVMTTSILLRDQCGRAYVAALDYDTILFV